MSTLKIVKDGNPFKPYMVALHDFQGNFIADIRRYKLSTSAIEFAQKLRRYINEHTIIEGIGETND